MKRLNDDNDVNTAKIEKVVHAIIDAVFSYELPPEVEKYIDVMTGNDGMCSSCGRKLVFMACEGFDAMTGEPSKALLCPTSPCYHNGGHHWHSSPIGFWANAAFDGTCKRCGKNYNFM